MDVFLYILQGIRRRLARWIAPRPAAGTPQSNGFYPQQPSCQIPYLDYLLEKFLGKRDYGHYVEVGAYDGLTASNTWGLSERGWSGVLCEPIPDQVEACRTNYRSRRRIRVIQTAAGKENGEIILHLAGPLTTANRGLLDEYSYVKWARGASESRSITVQCQTLDQILTDNSVPEGFDLLVVDVEGYEAAVFAGLSLTVWKPRMLIVELSDTHPHLTVTEAEDAVLGKEITEAGYVVVYKDRINAVFVREDVWMSAFGI